MQGITFYFYTLLLLLLSLFLFYEYVINAHKQNDYVLGTKSVLT